MNHRSEYDRKPAAEPGIRSVRSAQKLEASEPIADPRWLVPANQPVIVLLISAAMLGLMFLAAAVALPWVREECGRLAPTQIVLLWLGDILGLAWFVWFLLGTFARLGPAPRREIRNPYWPMVALAVALVLDAAAGIHALVTEVADFDRAIPVDAEVTGIQCDPPAGHDDRASFRVHCRFTDRAGTLHHVVFPVGYNSSHPKPWEWASASATRPADPASPLQLAIRYDPARPGRAWSEMSQGRHINGIEAMAVLRSCAQMLALIPAAITVNHLRRRKAAGGTAPWWMDLHKLGPVIVSVIITLLWGLMQRPLLLAPYVFGGAG